MRKIILAIVGALAILGAFMLGLHFIEKNQKQKPKFKREVKTVFVETVKNTEIPIVLSANGNIVAKRKIALFSEVQGVLETSKKMFKAGANYKKGATLLQINNDEFLASLRAQKSNLYNLMTSMMPDIRLDFSSEFEKWNQYLSNFNLHKNIPKLPKFSSDKEKYFINGRGIITAFYNIQNLEVRLKKFRLKAPFSGNLTEALVTPGSLVRVGQKLGEFIDPSVYELEVSLKSKYADLIKIGNSVSVTLSNLEKLKKYTGTVSRVNGRIDLTSQTIKVYIEVAHPSLKEGTFLEANLVGKSEKNAFEISKKLLQSNSFVYVVEKDSVLTKVNVNPVYFKSETVVVKGLKNGSKILQKSVPGSFDGMIVKINKSK